MSIQERQIKPIEDFLKSLIDNEPPKTTEQLDAFLKRIGLRGEIAHVIRDINNKWNLGVFESFAEYIHFDKDISFRAFLGSERLQTDFWKPNLFSNAEKAFKDRLRSHKYRDRFYDTQRELREAGGILNLRRIQAAKRKELHELQRAEKEHRILQIQNLFPSHWTSKPATISELVDQRVEEEDIDEARQKTIFSWFTRIGLDPPSAEQAQVIGDCIHSLKVVARAGSGKTRTIAQKILFLVHYLNHRPDEILALVFNRGARDELQARIQFFERQAGLISKGSFKVLTFDALAYNIVNPSARPVKEVEQARIIKDIVLSAIDNDEQLRSSVESLMVQSFKSDWEAITRLSQAFSKKELERLRSFLFEETIDGKQVKSRPEKRIADFLFEHDIPYLYERPFPIDDGHVIRPDFYLPTHRVVIEYYGLRGDKDYEDSIDYKRQYWNSRNDITLIEINPGFICEQGSNYDGSTEADYQALAELLSARTSHLVSRIEPQRLSDGEVAAKLRDRIRLTFVELLQSAITRAGQIHCTDIELQDLLSAYRPSTNEEKAFLDMLLKFEAMYRDRLANNNQTDYSQIKKDAIQKIFAGKTVLHWDSGRNGIDLSKLKYVFVDEFQDFSELFRGLLLAVLHCTSDALVNAVGDDWQMINRFAGSKPELYHQFDGDYPNPKTVYLQTNYRSSGGIVEFCNAIMKTNGINDRMAIPCNELEASKSHIMQLERDMLPITPREELYFKGDQILASIFRFFKPLTEGCHRLAELQDGDRICFAISRTNNPPVQVKSVDLGIRACNQRELINQVVDRRTPDSLSKYFEAITAHSSKGLEADAVIVLQPRQFPMIRQRSLFLQIFGDTPDNLWRDELNLFYVCCSRAKHTLMFLPEKDYMTSPFLERISDYVHKSQWNDFPCRLKRPENLFTISIQNHHPGANSLFAASEVLNSYGFTYFHRPGKVPTRSQQFRLDFRSILHRLKEVAQACADHDLAYRILDGNNREVHCLIGLQSINEMLAGQRKEG